MKPPKRFLDNPADIKPEVEELVKVAEKEEVKQEEIKEKIEEVETTPEQRLIIKLWVVVGILAGILFLQYVVTPIARGLKYTMDSGDVIQYAKEHANEVGAIMIREQEQTAKATEERMTDLCSKVTDQTTYCEKAKPLPTPTAIPTVKISYPTP